VKSAFFALTVVTDDKGCHLYQLRDKDTSWLVWTMRSEMRNGMLNMRCWANGLDKIDG
jgi:hypothetical protein